MTRNVGRLPAAAARRILVSMLLHATVCSVALNAAAAQQPAQLPAPAPEQPVAGYRARVLGVFDESSGDPIANARISDFLSGTSALTNSNGLVSLIFLPDGGSLVRIQKLGYEPQVTPVAISPSDTIPVTLLLRPLATGGVTRLPGVTTTAAAPYLSPALRGFQERKKGGATGYFINDTTLRNNESHQLADLMRSRLPSVNVGGGNGRGTSLLKSARCVSASTDPPAHRRYFSTAFDSQAIRPLRAQPVGGRHPRSPFRSIYRSFRSRISLEWNGTPPPTRLLSSTPARPSGAVCCCCGRANGSWRGGGTARQGLQLT